MKSYRFKALLQNNGWLENAVVTLDDGKIFTINQHEENFAESVYIDGYALPGFQNAHSHAFQYAMAGLAERRVDMHSADDFWSWREMMYQLALNLDPEQFKIIATMLYSELIRHGYTNVAEFHYVHHEKNGSPYQNLAAMGESLIEAAKDAGIKITLIPIFYQKGGFNQPPNERQRRFISSTFDDYIKLFEASARACKVYDGGANIAVGIHSMRGVTTEDILRTVREAPQDVPFHIHIAEQLKEIEDALDFLGQRPVEWLSDNVELNERFHLVHATHLTDDETERLAKSRANVVLCPSTEGNLGDGIFPLRKFQYFNGSWSIGTDSHIGLNPLEELRILDYGQRLTTHRRDTFSGQEIADSGLFAFAKATVAGRRAMNNFETEFFAVGADFDACIIGAGQPLLADVKFDNLASAILYTADLSQVKGTFVKGRFFSNDQASSQFKDNFVECVRNFR